MAAVAPVPSATILALARDVLRLHAAKADDLEHRVVRPSAPILYFGDLPAYRASPMRVVTVGVNPSGEEFPASSPWSRLDCSTCVGRDPTDEAVTGYLRALNGYFAGQPYRRWFDRSYEPVLEGLGASYYRGATSTALHTDVCSPLATSPTWGRLPAAVQADLLQDGVPLWHRLINELDPHLIIASISRPHLRRISLESASEPRVVYTVHRARPYDVVARSVRCGDAVSLLVWAPASTTPFQPISHEHKRAVGRRLREVVDGR